MRWRHTARYWHRLGSRNPFGVILTGPDLQPGQWDADAFFRTGVQDVAYVCAQLAQLAPDLPRRRALDFGCGVGRITRALAAHFDAVTGVDVAASMIAGARRLNASIPNCTFRVNRAGRLRLFGDAAFDFVYSRLVLQHIPPRAAARYIAELVRVLAPGGVLMFQIPEPLEHDPDALFSAEERAFVDAPVAETPIKRLLPRWLIRGYRHVRFRRIVRRQGRVHRMYMFGMTRDAVLDVLRRAGALVLRVDADQSHGTEGPGYVYWITKRADASR
ncbi:MAG TPA: class I SAM-dependent methyltransferase [Vicinamibacterales bacterium]|nr:class I SAM-dependent methyltransferase [Vicinamibacterales bacterium]